DEHMRPDTTLEVLLALKPYFKKDGLVTAGNASGIADGAAATIVASEAFAKSHGLKPLGRLVAWAVVGVEPGYMGIGPAPAARKALQKAGMKLEQMDLLEVNEAFAPQYLAVERELGLVVAYLLGGLRVLREYERGVYFFLGRLWGAKGPGLIFLPPLFARMQKVSLRVVAMDIPPQDVITRDNISIKVNAVLYMKVRD